MTTLQPATLAPAAPPHTYLGIARALVRGVRPLATAPNCALPLAFVSAQAVECMLKAALSKDGNDGPLKHPNVGHNLGELWTRAHAAGLGISAASPDWLRILASLHGRPYHLRYSTGVHALGLPPVEPMCTEVEQLLALVEAFVRT